MSDSDDDSLPNNVFTFQNDNTTISARGPNMNNITGLSFRNNVLTSTMHMPVNFERQRYCGSNFDQRSMDYRRDILPMSSRSIPDYGPPSFSHSIYQNGMGVQRSMYNGRSGSPMSVRSIDSTASVSAADIVFAFKNVKFNKYDLRIIKDAYNKLIKTRQRKRIEKRRNLKLFLKGTRQKSGEDSGEQGSDSSISSDDCRSVKTTICKENIPGLRQDKHFNMNMQKGTNHVTNVPHNMKEISMFTDCTRQIKQNSLRNMMAISNSTSDFNAKERVFNITTSNDQDPPAVKVQNISVITQKDRFKKGFLLPSQRFNKPISGQAQVTNNGKNTKTNDKNTVDSMKSAVLDSGSEQEEIFHRLSEKDIQNCQRKRSLETEDSCYSNKKRNKQDLPQKKNCEDCQSTDNKISNTQPRDFIFAKPKMPPKKVNTKKDLTPEKLLAKSCVPLITEAIDFDFSQRNKNCIENKVDNEIEEECTQSDILHSSDTSMRPSFIKRKLFTQKLDVAEHQNASNDSLRANSPQNIYSASIRERNKARKLVTSQSCLSREVPGEDNIVLDLIHKIIPPNQINMTNIANKSENNNKKSCNNDNSNKWDVTAVIANCDNQDISDTYTDEEIFNVNHDKKSEMPKKSVQISKKEPQCKVVIHKVLPEVLNKITKNNQLQNKSVGKDPSKKSVTDCVKTFWDTDFESDMEFNVAPAWKTTAKQNHDSTLQKQDNNLGNKQNRNNKKAPIAKGTILTVRNSHKDSVLNTSVTSHISAISSDKKGLELSKPNVIVEKTVNTIVDRNKIETNSISQTGKKRDIVKENVPVNNVKQKAGRKPKTKQCVDCVQDKPIKTPKIGDISAKLIKEDDKLEGKKHYTKNSSNNGLLIKTTIKSKEFKNSKQTNTDNTKKVIKKDQKDNTKSQKELVSNGRIQPSRKSKERSFVQSSTLQTITSNKASNKTIKTKPRKDIVSHNTSINNISTIITRSRDKLSLNSSQDDHSSLNLSNISNRSLRLRQRVQRNIN